MRFTEPQARTLHDACRSAGELVSDVVRDAVMERARLLLAQAAQEDMSVSELVRRAAVAASTKALRLPDLSPVTGDTRGAGIEMARRALRRVGR